MPIRPARTQRNGSQTTGSGLVSSLGRIRPMLAVGVLSLALVTACSSGDNADESTTSTTAASSVGSSEVESSAAPTAGTGDDESAEAPSSAATGGSDPSGESSADAAPPADPSASAEAPTGEPAPGTDAAPEEAEEGTACGGITVTAVNEAIGGGTLESAIDVTVDSATGDVSCIFSATTTIDAVLVDKAALTTYLGGELDGLTDAEVLDSLAEVHGSTQTEVDSVDSTVGGLTVRTLTGTDVTGAANALSVTVTDGNLVAVSASGPTLAEAGLAEATLAVLELALNS